MRECSLTRFVGWDSDEVFGYSTQKLVWIRDRHIGYIYYSIVASVLVWILGYQILWSNKHFLQKDVDGLGRMWYSHPTVGNCDPAIPNCKSDFESLTKLPYCDAYEGKESNPQRAHCSFENKITAIPRGLSDSLLFIPTAVEVVTERQACRPGPSNGYTCINEYEAIPGSDCLGAGGYMCKTRGNKTNQFYYIADVRNFKIRFTSSYERDSVRGTSLMHRAHVGICSSRLRSERKVRTWEERSGLALRSWCSQGGVKLKMLPCAPGVDCGKLRNIEPHNRSSVGDWLHNASDLAGQEEGNGSSFVDWLSNYTGGPRTDRSAASPAATEAPEAPPSPRAVPSPPAVRRAYALGAAATEGSGGRAAAPRAAAAGGRGAVAGAEPRGFEEESGRPQRGRALLQRSSAEFRTPSITTESAQEPASSPPSPPPREARQRRGGEEHSNSSKSSLPPPIPRDLLAFSDSWGDVFSVGRLLELAGVDLDNDYNMDGWTTRQAGTALEVQAVYGNLYPLWSSFGYKPVMYHYEVRELMLPYYSQFKLAEVQPDDYPLTRRYEMQYGIMVRFKVGGDFGFFNILYFCVMLATAAASMAAASTITDYLVLYLHPRRDNFFHLKYQVSADFKDMWRCPSCGFMNELEHVTCKGVPKWMGPHETPECGTERPLVTAGMHRARAKSRVGRMHERELRRGGNARLAVAWQRQESAESSSSSDADEAEEEKAEEEEEEEEQRVSEAPRAASPEPPSSSRSRQGRLPPLPEEARGDPPTSSPRHQAPRQACLATEGSPRRELMRSARVSVTFATAETEEDEEEHRQPQAQDGGGVGRAAEASSASRGQSSAAASSESASVGRPSPA